MLRDPAAKRYAQAAFELARDRNELDAWEPAMRSLGEATASDEAIAFLDDRRVPGEAKEAFLTQVTGELPALTSNLVKLLESKRRLALLPQIAEFFQSLLDEHNGIAHAQVLTAVSIGDDERRALANRLSELTGKQVQVEIHEAPEILGGLVARIGDRLIDGSAKTKLLALKRQLARATR
ncbi:MAG: F0F1 ATP synthase subunit delta [Chloroflexi bacterium]|nr:F0F1 ATP synthase subunit delta [Chloroflexota bacterium]